MNILITICARGGSKGVKNKNIKEISGKPLIAYTIDIAKKWGRSKRIICSTDSRDIAEVAKYHGAEVPFMRPAELATDTSGKIPVIRHALVECEKKYKEKFDIIVDLDVTSPIRDIDDLDKGFEALKDKKADVSFSVTKARKNPYFNMVEINKEGYAQTVKNTEGKIKRRQDAPDVFDMNASIYFYKREFLLDDANNSVFSTKKAASFLMKDISSVDIDTELDFKFIDFLIKEKVITLDKL